MKKIKKIQQKEITEITYAGYTFPIGQGTVPSSKYGAPKTDIKGVLKYSQIASDLGIFDTKEG